MKRIALSLGLLTFISLAGIAVVHTHVVQADSSNIISDSQINTYETGSGPLTCGKPSSSGNVWNVWGYIRADPYVLTPSGSATSAVINIDAQDYYCVRGNPGTNPNVLGENIYKSQPNSPFELGDVNHYTHIDLGSTAKGARTPVRSVAVTVDLTRLTVGCHSYEIGAYPTQVPQGDYLAGTTNLDICYSPSGGGAAPHGDATISCVTQGGIRGWSLDASNIGDADGGTPDVSGTSLNIIDTPPSPAPPPSIDQGGQIVFSGTYTHVFIPGTHYYRTYLLGKYLALYVPDVLPTSHARGNTFMTSVASFDTANCFGDELPNLTASANCVPGKFIIHADDTDDTTANIRIDIYEDGKAGSGTRQYSGYTNTSGDLTIPLDDVLNGTITPGNTFTNPGVTNNKGSTDWAKRQFYVYAMSVDDSGDAPPNDEVPSAHTESAPINLGPCAQVSCSTSSVLGGTGVVGSTQKFRITMNVTNATTSPPSNAKSSVAVTATSGGGGTTNLTANNFVYSSGGSVTSDEVQFTPPKPGTYKATWDFAYTPDYSASLPQPADVSVGPCSDQGKYGYAPYFSSVGGDLAAGAGFGTSCTAQPSSIIGYNRDNDPVTATYFGAGSQLAALALGDINGVATAIDPATGGSSGAGTTGAGVLIPSGLGISNVGKPSGTSYGGAADISGWCVADYFKKAGTTTVNFPASPSVSDLSGTHVYRLTSGSSIGNITIQPGANITVIGAGNIKVTGDINYAYSSIGEIPQFRLVTSGNMWIDSSVANLHGIYTAQKTSGGTAGNIYTCATGITRLKGSGNYGNCKTPLVFYGAVAQEGTIFMDRTTGNLYPVAGTPAVPAETFEYTPELWLPSATALPNSSANVGSWDAINTLPPIL